MISATYEWAFDPKTSDEAFVELANAHNVDDLMS